MGRNLRLVYTLGAFVVLLGACATDPEQREAVEPPDELQEFAGTYTARISEGLSAERWLHLILRSDASIRLQTDYLYDQQTIVEYGEWELRNEDTTEPTIILAVLGRTDKTYDTPSNITLIPDAQGAILRATTYNEERYGTEGLRFRREPGR